MMDDFYTDEPIGWKPPDNLDDEGNPVDDADDDDNDSESLHSWDYYEPAPEDERSWQGWNQRKAPDAPVRIQQLISMIDRQPWQITMTKSFYEQALFMADFDDDAEIVPFNEYYPTYRSMSVGQLRSYFTIRKMLRHGQFPDVSLSYIFVYVYEILMQIGIRTPEEGYEILQELLSGYSATEPKLKKYVGGWIKDYVVYYNLKEHFADVFPDEQADDKLAGILKDYKSIDDKALIDAICTTSKSGLENAKLFRSEPDKAVRATAAALRTVIPIIEEEYGSNVTTLLLGKRSRMQVTMFQFAVFYSPHPVIDAEIYISPRHRYICSGGLWSADVFLKGHARASLFRTVLREIDCQLRPMLGVKPLLKPKDWQYHDAIGKALTAWLTKEKQEEARREAERRKIRIDFSKLGTIRNDAGVVQEKLLDGIEPDSSQPTPPTTTPTTQPTTPHTTQPPISIPPTPPTTPTPPATTTTLSPEKSFLTLFLSGGDWQQYLRDIHTPEGVMVENINNMAMDTIGDIVLEDNGDGLHLIEDYRRDIEEYINNNERQ